MKEDLPLVSIVTPSYNQGRFIRDTILSVKNQDYPNVEHIVVDGGSTDNTLEILRKYEKEYNLKWISEPDEGQSDAVNKGFKMAKGAVIGWLNSDDIYLSDDAISDIVMAFNKNPDIGVIYGDNIYFSEHYEFLGLRKVFNLGYNQLVIGIIPSEPACFFRRKVTEKYELNKQLQFRMDSDFWIRIAHDFKFRHINKVIAGDRLHSKMKRSTLKDVHRKEWKEHLNKQNLGRSYLFYRYFWYFPILLLFRFLAIQDILRTWHNSNFTVKIKPEKKREIAVIQFSFCVKSIFRLKIL